MCGICGFISKRTNKSDPYTLKRMLSAIRYRGPDDEGIFIKENTYLGSRRLSIIDIKSGKQPIHNEGKNIWLVFNGEIYNYPELKRILTKQGHKFYTKSDTEVIVHAYEEWGIEFPKYLNGMFAIAIWDIRKKRLILARDHLGIKPLYYSKVDDSFVFGSELTCLLKHPSVKKRLDSFSLKQYLIFGYFPMPNSILSNVKKLESSCILIYQDDSIKIKKYWEPKLNKFDLDSNELEEYLLNLLNDSIKKQLISDVPVGVFLSGGIDSSMVAYFMKKNYPSKIKSFSIGFADKSYDETKYSKIMSNLLHTQHYSQIFNDKIFSANLEAVIDRLDEPIADPSLIPSFYLSNLAAKHVKVVLSGDGGDELFGGYQTYLAQYLAQFYPSILKKVVLDILRLIPSSYDNLTLEFFIKTFLTGIGYSQARRQIVWLGMFPPEEINNIMQSKSNRNPFKKVDSYWLANKYKSLLGKSQYLDVKTYLVDDILTKVDRATMMNSLEARVPILDYRIVEFALSLPVKYKLSLFGGKSLLKKALVNKLPQVILNRGKKGFGIPVAKYLSKELFMFHRKPKFKNEVFEELFNYSYIDKLFINHKTHKENNRRKLWALYILFRWLDKNLS